MLTLTEQPRINSPVSKSRPVQWVITTDSHVTQTGNLPNFLMIFNETGAADGEQITLFGETYEVDNSEPYTESTFKATGTVQEVSENFANMLRCSYNFRDWAFFVSYFPTSDTWRVYGQYTKSAEELADFEFDVSGLSIDTTFNETNGRQPIIKDLRIWYRLYFQNGDPASPEKTAFLPYNINTPVTSGRVSIDFSETIRGLLSTDRPDITEGAIVHAESRFLRSFYLKFAEVETTRCIEIPGKVYTTQEVSVTNTVYQLREQREFRQHLFDLGRPAKFITTRPRIKQVCGNEYEWLHFYYGAGGAYTGSFTVQYSFYNGGNLVNTLTINEIPEEAENVYRIGVGTANAAVADNLPAGADRYEVRVLAAVELPSGLSGNVVITETAVRHIIPCGCKAAEVYFLEDTGGWQTVIFESIEQRVQESEGLQINIPLDFRQESGYINEGGGRSSQTYRADNPFTLETERLSEHNRDKYEQMLRSPRHYIRTANTSGQEALRPIVIERAAVVTKQQGQVTRLQVTFRYNAETRVH